MKIVVTGALGHIGSRLIRELPAGFPDAKILLLDDLSAQRYCSLFNLPAEGNYEFVEADILKADLRSHFAGATVVIHLAAITNAAGSFENAQQVEEVNFKGTELVARACLEAGCALAFLSTTSVYGTQNETVDEDCAIAELRPQSPYAESKLRAEQLLESLSTLPCSILRFGTIFGTSIGMRFHTAVNKFCWQALTGQPLTVWRTALDQKRPYLDLGDAVRALQFVIDRKLFDRKIYNVLTANATVREIVEIISQHVTDVSVQYVDTQIMNQLSYCVSNERFTSLGFEFGGSLQDGIADTMELLKGVYRHARG
jgi:nucleoside-diphosphate-sugar epimerase